MKAKLTETSLKALEPGAKDFIVWDTELSGFGLKVTPRGRKAFILQYRMGGRGSGTKKLTFGVHGDITLHQARQMAQQAKGKIASGIDPREERRQQQMAEADPTVSTAVERFLDQYASKNASGDETARILRSEFVPSWKGKTLSQINRSDVVRCLDKIRDRGSPIMANRALAAVRKMFNWHVGRAELEASPCKGLAAPAQERSRDRVLSDEELVKVLTSARNRNDVYGQIVELLILTGQRRSEVSELPWDELDLDNAVWNIPAARSKNNKAHRVHLSPRAVAIIQQRPHVCDFVFTTNGRTAFSGFSKAKKDLDTASGVQGWRLHDLRRTMVTGLANNGVQPHIADKILNHQSGSISGVAAVYQKAKFMEERKQALMDWADHVERLVNEIESGQHTQAGQELPL